MSMGIYNRQFRNLEQSNHFWMGMGCGFLLAFIVVMGIAFVDTQTTSPTSGEQLFTCTGDLAMTAAKLNALESKAIVIYEPVEQNTPEVTFHNLVEIRLAPQLQSAFGGETPPAFRPRWIVLPGETPIELWKSQSVAWAVYHFPSRTLEAPNWIIEPTAK